MYVLSNPDIGKKEKKTNARILLKLYTLLIILNIINLSCIFLEFKFRMGKAVLYLISQTTAFFCSERH